MAPKGCRLCENARTLYKKSGRNTLLSGLVKEGTYSFRW